MFRLITRLLASRYKPIGNPSKTVAILVPLSTSPELTEDEEISLRHLQHFLGEYDKFFIAPEGMNFERPGFRTKHFSRKFFGSKQAHSRLLYWPGFYKQFEDYKFILMHHLDALVFSDDLMEWCAMDLDYVGAPWLPCPDYPRLKEPRVGNGGLALMKIESVLNVLHERYRTEPSKYWDDQLVDVFTKIAKLLVYPKRLTPARLRPAKTEKLSKRLQGPEINVRNNDIFWSYYAINYFPEFKIPDWKTGLRFAFEGGPRHCFELNGNKLPFGCHAWPKYDRAFWEPYLMK